MPEDKESLGIREWIKTERPKMHEKINSSALMLKSFIKQAKAQTYEEALRNTQILIENTQSFCELYDEMLQERLENDKSLDDMTAAEFIKSGIDQEITDKAKNKVLELNGITPYEPSEPEIALEISEDNKSHSLSQEILPHRDIGLFKSIIPETFFIINNKLSNEITKDFLNNGEIPLAVINPKKKGEVRTYNSLTYEGDNISITGRQDFTAYDRAIHNAVGTLKEYGNDIITPQMVFRTLNGMTESEYVSPQSTNKVRKSIDKSRFMRLRVNFKDEATIRKLNIDNAYIDSNLLYAQECVMLAGGKEVPAYRIIETPVLYKYSQLTKQIISIPLSLLDTRAATRNTEEMIPIKEYLIRRIEIMKHKDDTSNRIIYDKIFDEVGIIIKHNTERDRYRKYITAILKLWKEKDYIKGFKEYKEGKSIKGIEITY